MSSLHHHNDLTGYSLGDHNITSTSGVSKIKAATNQKVVAKGEYDRRNHREVYTSLIHSGYVFEKLKFVFSSFDILSFNEKMQQLPIGSDLLMAPPRIDPRINTHKN